MSDTVRLDSVVRCLTPFPWIRKWEPSVGTVGSGSPVVGRALLQLVRDRTIDWTAEDRGYIMPDWRNAILTRTYGYADPEDPATW